MDCIVLNLRFFGVFQVLHIYNNLPILFVIILCELLRLQTCSAFLYADIKGYENCDLCYVSDESGWAYCCNVLGMLMQVMYEIIVIR
jgi:hypothetical protein